MPLTQDVVDVQRPTEAIDNLAVWCVLHTIRSRELGMFSCPSHANYY